MKFEGVREYWWAFWRSEKHLFGNIRDITCNHLGRILEYMCYQLKVTIISIIYERIKRGN